MNGDDITTDNRSIPWWPDGMPLWQKVLCLFGYHKRETRQKPPGHRLGNGKLTTEPMHLRDQCGRCGTLL